MRGSVLRNPRRPLPASHPSRQRTRQAALTAAGDFFPSVLPPSGLWLQRCQRSILNHRGKFPISPQSVGPDHLARRLAIRLQHPRSSHEDADTPRPARGHVQSVGAVEEPESPRGILGRRARHRVDDHGRFLALELVNRHCSRWLEQGPQIVNMGIPFAQVSTHWARDMRMNSIYPA